MCLKKNSRMISKNAPSIIFRLITWAVICNAPVGETYFLLRPKLHNPSPQKKKYQKLKMSDWYTCMEGTNLSAVTSGSSFLEQKMPQNFETSCVGLMFTAKNTRFHEQRIEENI